MRSQLSPEVGDRTPCGISRVAEECLGHPTRLLGIVAGLSAGNNCTGADCAEVLRQVVEQRPDLVAPFPEALVPMISHRNGRARWGAMHALGEVAALRTDVILAHRELLLLTLREDKSVIARDFAAKALANATGTGRVAAEALLPALEEALTLWAGKHAKRTLEGMARAAAHLPERRAAFAAIVRLGLRQGGKRPRELVTGYRAPGWCRRTAPGRRSSARLP